MTDLMQLALREAELQGASDSEVYFMNNKETEVFVENNDLKQAKSQVSESLGIRVFLRGCSAGFYSINQLTPDRIREAAKMAVKIAKITPADRNNVMPSLKKKVPLLRGIYDKKSESFEAAEAAKNGAEMLRCATSIDPRISVDSGNFGSSILFHSIANSNGIRSSERISTFYWSIMGMAIDGSDVSNFDAQSEGSHFVKKIDVTRAAEEFAQNIINSLGSRKIESFKGEMILTPSAASEIIGDVVAHSINSESVQRRSSAFANKIGKRVASELLTIEDDATNTEGLAAASFDREGIGHHRNIVIKNGILSKFLYNSYTAKKDDVKSTGNAVGSSASPPSVSTTNLVIGPGSKSYETLVSEISRGILVTRFSGNVNPVTGDFSGVVKGGRLILKGTLGNAVKEVMVAGNVFDAMRKLTGVTRERKVMYNMILPYMRFDHVSFVAG